VRRYVGLLFLTGCQFVLGIEGGVVRPDADGGGGVGGSGGVVMAGGGGTGGGGPGGGGGASSLVVFFTTNRYGPSVDFNNVADADVVCRSEAMAVGIEGFFVAWLSSSLTGDAIDRLPDGPRWVLRDGTQVFEDRSAISEGPDVPIVSAQGSPAGVFSPVWTGTNAMLGASNQNCLGWSSASEDNDGLIGLIGLDPIEWTQAGPSPCNGTSHLYCFQTGPL
jgi:hypothetical protein